VFVLGEVFTRRTAVAGALGVGGVALLVIGLDAALDPIGLAAAFGGTVSMATGVVLTKHWGRPVDLMTFTGWQLTAGGLMLVPVALLAEGIPPAPTLANLVGFGWLAIVGTGVAYSLWFRGVQILPVAMTSFLVLLSPLMATALGWVFLSEDLTPLQIVGAAIVAIAVIAPQLAGVATQRRSRQHDASAQPATHIVDGLNVDESLVATTQGEQHDI
jgi:probable blue pigment (indigoidine) exporter